MSGKRINILLVCVHYPHGEFVICMLRNSAYDYVQNLLTLRFPTMFLLFTFYTRFSAVLNFKGLNKVYYSLANFFEQIARSIRTDANFCEQIA